MFGSTVCWVFKWIGSFPGNEQLFLKGKFLNGQYKAGWVNTCQKLLNKAFIHYVD